MSSIHLNEIIEQFLTRRQLLKGAAAAAVTTTLAGCSAEQLARSDLPLTDPGQQSTLTFEEIPHEIDQDIHVANGYQTQVVVRWGDSLFEGAAELDPDHISADTQQGQFGYNNDFVAYMPLPLGSQNSEHGLLCVNNEYTNAELMFAGIEHSTRANTMSRDQTLAEMAAQGLSVVEIRKQGNHWEIVKGSYNRRITPLANRINFSGPVAGHPRLISTDNPDGKQCTGTFNNCAGGVTPWGTVLTCEENFQEYFGGDLSNHPERENIQRYGVGPSQYSWYRFFRRFNAELEPNGPHSYGWIVEFDPYDPESIPVKRTALGRFRHEGATTALTADGRLVVYSGDDQGGQFFYRFVTRDICNHQDRVANQNILDHGTLAVARYEPDGTMKWLPLVFGTGKLTRENGFESQADVLIETRKAAELLGATPMDRPEDAETNPLTGKVYLMLTNNRTRVETNEANPRPNNIHGHVIEMSPPLAKPGDPRSAVDHGADEFHWQVFLKAGDPSDQKSGAQYHDNVTEHGWLSCPDNCTFDRNGRIWIATDGARGTSNIGDGIYACDTEGEGRALTRQFFRGCIGAEICGPCFTPDNKTMFLAVQHPGEGSTFDQPSTRWPDFDEQMPPRPSIVAITKNDGGPIG